MLCKCSGKYIDIYFILKITFYVILSLHVTFKPRLHGFSLLAPINYPCAKEKLVNCPGEFTVQDSGK